MEKYKYIFHKVDTFNNLTDGGIIKAREVLDTLKATNKPFLDKHPEYVEDYNFSVKELTTELEYYIYNKDLYGSE